MLSKSAAVLLFILVVACRSPHENPPASTQPAPVPTRAPVTTASAPPPPTLPEASPVPEPATSATPPLTNAQASPPNAAESGKARALLVLGDSLSDPRAGGGGFLAAVTAACPATRIDNRAKGGFMVNQIRKRFDTEVAPRLPGGYTDLLVFGGVNDLYSDETAGRSVAKIQRDLSTLYAAGRAHGLHVIAFTVAPWGGFKRYFNERRARTTEELNAWIAEQREQGKVDVVIDAYALLSCGDPERLCPQFEPPHTDGLHFGRLGHEKLGAALVKQAFADCTR